MAQSLRLHTTSSAPVADGVLVLYAHEGAPPSGLGGASWAATGLDWAKVAATAAFSGRQGQVLDLIAPPGLDAARLLVLGAGRAGEADFPATVWTDRGGSLAGKLQGLKVEKATIVLEAPVAPERIADLVAGMHLRLYRFDRYKSSRKEADSAPETLDVTLHVPDKPSADAAIAARLATVEGIVLARDLVNEPANVLGTVEFTDRLLGLRELGVEVEVLEEAQLRELGMNALLAVARGSARPPRLVIMRWRGGAGEAAPLAVVGKGVVFDTGGISIKPAAGMEDMKGDMGGAAAVAGLMHALAARRAPTDVVGVVGLVENMPGAAATRPGDIVKAMSGTTIEINNTDAEGRLVLADALWYTQQRFAPRAVIDLATLTGAILVALGHEHAGLFSNDDELAGSLLAAGLASGDKLWRMPLGPAYDKLIESRFADIKNTAGRYAGSVTAAQFLQRFVNDVPWAHLDIAGAAFGTNSNEINLSWASGFGVALLDRLVRDRYED